MRQSREFLVITFSETSDAMAAEKLFQEQQIQQQIPGRIIPIPRQLSAGCGLSWKTEPALRELVGMALDSAGIRWHEMELVKLWV